MYTSQEEMDDFLQIDFKEEFEEFYQEVMKYDFR